MVNVIGGGPVGLWAARRLADRGLSVTVFEEHRQLGRPEHCTGLFSRNIERLVKFEPIQYVNGAKFFAGKEVALLERRKAAGVYDRAAFDRHLGKMALSSGVKLVHKRVSWRDFEGKIVAADGAASSTRRDLGQKMSFLPAQQFELKVPGGEFVELHFEEWNPDYFVWVVPRGDSTLVGTASRNLLPLGDWVKKKFKGAKILRKTSGLVITSGPVKRSYFNLGSREVYLVGDAAGQVKPTTGGGVYLGLRCAEILARELVDGDYERAWRGEFSRELALQRVARWAMVHNPEGFVRFLRRSKLDLEVYGDMDHQSEVLSKIILRAVPWVAGAGWRAMRSLFKR